MINAATELAKLPAFVRRDLKIALSYRTAAVSGLLAAAAQAVVFSFIGKLVDPSRLPKFGTTHATYLEFVTIGVGLNMVVLLMVHQLATAIRAEQMMGTLESLLVTPTKIATMQVGSAAFELIYIPLRIGLFVAVIEVIFGLGFHLSGILPAAVVMAAFFPFLWGLGLLSGGAILTFRRGAGVVTTGGTLLGLASGAFFPLSLLPHSMQAIASKNPLAIAVHSLRETLIGGTAWMSVGSDVLKLVPLSIGALIVGAVAFRLALTRERRNGTLGLY
jgi:ABC-2 type transport system permease protein